MSTEQDRETLRNLLREKSYEKRGVVLTSGLQSDWYIDGKHTTLHPLGLKLVGELIFDRLRGAGIEAVGGPTMGADPLVTATALVSQLRGEPMAAFVVRKEPKFHGTSAWIEGKNNLREGMKVAILEDVITTGGSILHAIHRAETEGLVVARVLVVVDRCEGGREKLAEAGYQLESLFTREDILGPE
ncbi:MAG: orotate phosphoribosyltransferase [Nitrospinota bacterium]